MRRTVLSAHDTAAHIIRAAGGSGAQCPSRAKEASAWLFATYVGLERIASLARRMDIAQWPCGKTAVLQT